MTDLLIAALTLGVTWLVISDWLRSLQSRAETTAAIHAAEAFHDSGDYDDAIRLANSGAVTYLPTATPIHDDLMAEHFLDQLDTGVPEGWGQ